MPGAEGREAPEQERRPHERGETLIGTAYADAIRAGGGDDEAYGLRGPDRLVGGQGNDRLFGGPGDDHMAAFDGVDGRRDLIDCGPGHDTFEADQRDVVRGDCEEGSVSQP